MLILEFVRRRRRRASRFISNHIYHFYELSFAQSEVLYEVYLLQTCRSLFEWSCPILSKQSCSIRAFWTSCREGSCQENLTEDAERSQPVQAVVWWRLPLSGHPFIKNNYVDTSQTKRFRPEETQAIWYLMPSSGWSILLKVFCNSSLQLIPFPKESFEWRDLPNRRFVPLMCEICLKMLRDAL